MTFCIQVVKTLSMTFRRRGLVSWNAQRGRILEAVLSYQVSKLRNVISYKGGSFYSRNTGWMTTVGLDFGSIILKTFVVVYF